MDGEDIVCDICGDAGQEENLVICNKCTDGAEHIYCMGDKLDKVPEGDWWMCEDCKKSESKKSISPVNLESSAYRYGVQSEAQSLKEDRVTKMSAKACDNTLLHKDFSGKTFKSGKAKETKDTASELQISCNPQDKAKVSHAEETKATEGKYVSGVAAAKSGNRNISFNDVSTLGSNRCRLDAVQSCGQVDCRLQSNSHKAHRDLNCLEKDKKNENWQDEQRTEAATAMKLHELCTRHGCDKKSQFEAATLPEDFSIPSLVYTWNGKFEIHRVEGIASTCVGMQAYVSTCASEEVLAVVGSLPDIIVLEELPLLKLWPSQFVESQAPEENIALYFFEKDLYSNGTYHRGLIEYMSKHDLALKGNLDGVELQIFPFNVLPGKLQCWNKLLFLWGVFREHKIDNSANTLVRNSQKLPESATPEVGPFLSIENVDDQPSKDLKVKMPTEETKTADNVKPHDKLPMDEKINTDRPESLASTTSYEENLNQLYWQAVEILSSKFGL